MKHDLNNKKLYSIQLLRGIACFAVIISHALSLGMSNDISMPMILTTSPELITLGHFGVDLFFIISGFIMFVVHYKDFGKEGYWKKFLLARFIRLIPIYWLLSTLALLVLILLPELFRYRSSPELLWVLGSYTFIPFTTSYGLASPLLGVGWSLNYEMFFYISFSIFLYFFKSYKSLCLLALLFILAVFIEGDWSVKQTPNMLTLVTSPLLIEFVIGLLCGYLYIFHESFLNKYRTIFGLLSFFIFSLGFLHLPDSYGARLLYWGGGSAFLLISTLMYESNFKVNNLFIYILECLGTASYSIYLIQVFTLPFFSKLLLFSFSSTNWVFYTITLCSGTLFVGFLFWKLVEVPITNRLKQIFQSKKVS